mmetsp:Transcript_7915/g.14351  ORF Transcript_7915/g.14351 Transcript_7915/m.14351 type:complete len:82 (+) Transcript_7915:101-346(+)
MSGSSELKVAEKWDHAIELGVKRIGYGGLGGCAAALILFRSSRMRAGVVGLGIGLGLGITYAETKRDFETLSIEPPLAESQ